MEVKKLTQIGGSEWQKGNMHRVYFNNLISWYGLDVEYYNSGNISAAWLDGKQISNSQAKEYVRILRNAKFWYDVNEDAFYGKGISSVYVNKIAAAIKEVVK